MPCFSFSIVDFEPLIVCPVKPHCFRSTVNIAKCNIARYFLQHEPKKEREFSVDGGQ